MQEGRSSSSLSRQRKCEGIVAEAMRAMDRGEQVRIQDWLARYPDFAIELRDFFEQHQQLEALVRPIGDVTADVLFIRCPFCHQRIELPEDTTTNIDCLSCKGSFSLISPETTQYSRGTRLGHYELLDPVGTGQFGTVWRARDAKLDRTVAIKVPRDGSLDSAQAETILRDARAGAQLNHSNIVSVHEIGKLDDTIFLVSDFVDGVTLKEWSQSARPTARMAARLCETLAMALHHAHSAGVVHRDLKPGNIMVDQSGEPYIVDFGLAKRDVGELTMTVDGRILGTPAYMSPEQAAGKGHTVDGRADMYSLGVVLFELLTGELPFRGERQTLMEQVLNDAPPNPRELKSTIPKDLETICLKCLSKQPNQRFNSAHDLGMELGRFLKGEPIHSRPIGPISAAWRWVRRKPVYAMLITLAVLSMVSGTVASTLFAIVASGEAEKARQSEGLAEQASGEMQRERDKARQNEYCAHMRLAQQAATAGNAKLLGRLLKRYEPKNGRDDLRKWEWYYLNTQLHPEEMLFRGHSDRVVNAVWSPDGTRVFSASWDDTVKTWDTVREENIHSEIVQCDEKINAMDRDPTGRYLALADDAQVSVRVVADNRPICTLPTGGMFLKFSPNGGRLAVATRFAISVWTLPDPQDTLANVTPDMRIDLGPLSDEAIAPVRTVSWSPDGNFLATGEADSRYVRIWDAHSGEQDRTVQSDGFVTSVAWSSDGRRFISGSTHSGYGYVTVWDANDWHVEASFVAHRGATICLASNGDGAMLASGGSTGAIKVWNVSTQTLNHDLRGHQGATRSLVWSPDEQQLLSSGDDGTVRVWTLDAGSNQLWLDGIGRFALSGDGQRIAAIGRGLETEKPTTISIFQTQTGRAQSQMTFPVRGWLTSLSWNPRNPHLLASTLSGPAPQAERGCVVWNVAKSEPIVKRNGFAAYGVAFDPTGRLVAIGCDRTVKVWDFAEDNIVAELHGHDRRVGSVAWSPNGEHLATTCYEQYVKIWDTDRWTETGSFRRSQVRSVEGGDGQFSISWSPDGKRLIAGGADGRIYGWQIHNGEQWLEIDAHLLSVWCVAYHPDGSRFASGSEDGSIKIWNAINGQELISFDGTRGVGAIGWGPSGRRLVASFGDSMRIGIWDSIEGHEE